MSTPQHTQEEWLHEITPKNNFFSFDGFTKHSNYSFNNTENDFIDTI